MTEVDQQYLEKIKDEHMALGRKISRFRRLVESRATPEELQNALIDLKAELAEHFELEEEGGYFSDAVEVAPRLKGQVDRLLAEHTELLDIVGELLVQSETCQDDDEAWKKFHAHAIDFVKRQAGHERAENSMVQEAYERDIGDKD